jgi:ribonuclease P protein component
MLPKAERLKEKYIFNIAFKKKQKISSPLVTLYYFLEKKDINRFKNKKNAFPKVAFIVSTKIDKRASQRNLIKRRMKAAYTLLKKNIPAENIRHINALIWIANPSVKNVDFQGIKSTMNALIIKLDKLRAI